MFKRGTLAALASCAVVSALLTAAALHRAQPAESRGTTASQLSANHIGLSDAGAAAVTRYIADTQLADSAFALLGDKATKHDMVAARTAFLNARLAYKRLEFLAEHYTPVTAAAINGPAIDKPDDENPRIVVRPTGLQVMETMLFGADASESRLDSVAIQASIARINLRRLRERASETHFIDAQLFEAARLQIARVVSLGISGFDAPLAGTSLLEAAESVRSIAGALSGYAPGSVAAESLKTLATHAVQALEAPGVTQQMFDHFAFVAQLANPLANQIGALQSHVGVTRMNDPRAFSANANTLFDSGAFHSEGFAPPGARATTPELVAVGERLFFDKRLSGQGDRSCATCHQPTHAFADARESAELIAVHHAVTPSPQRNTPTLYNAALQATAFADSRVASLEMQVRFVVNNPREMGGDLDAAAATLYDDALYRAAFEKALGARSERASFSRDLQAALAGYMRSLVRLDSRFDFAMRGNAHAVTRDEQQGFNVFMGKARCGSCHFAGLFNGTRPPEFNDSEVEVLGVPSSARAHATLDADKGVGAADGAPLHNYAFKTPTVRNAAVTAPYMHNGVFKTLEEVVDFYDAGGGVGRGLHVANQTLSSDSLHLTAREKRQLIAFMGALTDTTSALQRPIQH